MVEDGEVLMRVTFTDGRMLMRRCVETDVAFVWMF